MKTIAQHYAEFTSNLCFEDLPAEVVTSAQRHILDTFGVGVRGRLHENAVNSLQGLLSINSSHGSVSVWGSSKKLSCEFAALSNGIASHCLDFDDTHTDSIVHGSAVILPVVIAIGESLRLSGKEVLTAFVAGWEVAARIGLASKGTFHKRGFHTTSIAGIFGAVTAASKLLNLSAEQITHAIGLAGSQAAGINEYLSNSSSPKSLHPGWSAFSAILASNLSKAGMTGPKSVFEGRDGIFKTYGIELDCDLREATKDLSAKWEVTRISIKPYPCCHFAHAFIDCIGNIVNQGIEVEMINSIKCFVPELEQPLICEPFDEKLRPKTIYGAKFSLPFLIAAKVIDKKISHTTFNKKNLNNEKLLAISDLVTYETIDPDNTLFPKTFPGHVCVALKDGRSITEKIDINIGHPDNPISDQLLIEKFRSNCDEIITNEAVEKIIEHTMIFSNTPINELTQYLQKTK